MQVFDTCSCQVDVQLQTWLGCTGGPLHRNTRHEFPPSLPFSFHETAIPGVYSDFRLNWTRRRAKRGGKEGEGGSDIGLGHLLGGALAPPCAGKMRNCEQTERCAREIRIRITRISNPLGGGSLPPVSAASACYAAAEMMERAVGN